MSITFQEINAQILPLFKSVIQQWLPGGHFSGEEYTVRNPLRTDDRPGSFKINATTGYWSDFATGDKGGDLVSLYAYINNTNQGKAVADLSRFFGVQDTTAKKKGKRIYTELLWPCPADTPPRSPESPGHTPASARSTGR